MVAYTELLRLVAGFLEEVYSDPNSPTGLNKVKSLLIVVEGRSLTLCSAFAGAELYRGHPSIRRQAG